MQRFDSTVYTTHHLRAEKASVERVLLALRSANRGRGDGGGGAGGDGHVSDTTHSPAWHDKLWCLLQRQYPGSDPLLYTAAWEAAQECKCAQAEIELRLEADARAVVASKALLRQHFLAERRAIDEAEPRLWAYYFAGPAATSVAR